MPPAAGETKLYNKNAVPISRRRRIELEAAVANGLGGVGGAHEEDVAVLLEKCEQRVASGNTLDTGIWLGGEGIALGGTRLEQRWTGG